MTGHPSYPLIEPTNFDLIAVGTGLPESVIAAAASASGKTVLHLDPNPFYGSNFSSLSLPELTSFLTSNSTPPSAAIAAESEKYLAVNLITRPLYSGVEISSSAPDLTEEQSRKFLLDVAGPRVLFCAEKSVDLLLKSGASQYVEFKGIDASFVGGEGGKLWNVPDSRAAIFKDKSLSLMEKNQLMKFFKLVQQHLASVDGANANDDDGEEEEGEGAANSKRIPDEDLESPFVEFLAKMRLPSRIKSIVLYAIAMADYDQETAEVCEDVLKTKDGIDRLALYQSSVGRFANARGAFLYPIYGQGELPQTFCRRAAVKGCIYVLRMPVISLLMDKISGSYKGVRLASGQDIFSHKLVLDPSFTVPQLSASVSDLMHEKFRSLSSGDVKQKVARGICITRNSLKSDVSNLLIVYPPRSLYPEQGTSVRVLQMGGNLAICPSGMFVLYMSALCEDADQGKQLLSAATKALLMVPDSENSESGSTVQRESTEEARPTLVWSALYIQELKMGQCDSISSTPMPDGKLNYHDLLDEAMMLFQKMYPDDEFFPEETSPEDSEDNIELSLET